jgi:hypothetical protein
MLGSHQDFYSEEEPRKETNPIRQRLLQMVGLLAPEQRLMLSFFLFMDVCVICFGCLVLFQKIGLPF